MAAAGMTGVELRSADGTRLRADYYPGHAPRGGLVISHGLGEHAGCYRHVAEALGAVGLDVLALDYRGHGRSPGRRGAVENYGRLVEDLTAALEFLGHDNPRFILGHSNGGQVALRLAMADPSAVDGLILSNPSIRLAARVPPHKWLVGQILRRIAPGLTLSTGLPDSMMVRDPTRFGDRSADPLRHTSINPALYFGMVAGGEILQARASEIIAPTLMVLGDDDPLIDHRASLSLLDRIGSADKRAIVVSGGRHEPLNDLGAEALLAEIGGWIEARLDARHAILGRPME